MFFENWFFSLCSHHVEGLIFVADVSQTKWDGSKKKDSKTCRPQVPLVVLDKIFSEITEFFDSLVRMQYYITIR